MPTYVFGDDLRMFALIPTSVQTGAYSATANQFVPCDSTAAGFTVTLPAAPADQTLIGVKLVAGSNTVTVACSGSDHINTAAGSTTTTLTATSQGVVLQYSAALAVWYGVMNSGSSSGGAVSSVFGRAGAVAATSGDYSFPQISGTAGLAQGGTGQTTQQAAINALTGTQSAGSYLRSDGTNATLAAIQAADVPTLNQNTSGSAASFTGSLAGDVTGTQAATAVGKVQGVALTANQATLVANLTNATTRSATATVNPGEETIFTGSTASQTLTLPASPVASSINTITNTASVSVTLAPNSGQTLSNFGTTGNITIPSGYAFQVIYIGTTWYVQSAGPSDFAKSNVLSVANGGLGFGLAPVAGAGATVTGVSVATALASGLTLPANMLATGQVYSFEAWGTVTTTSTAQTVALTLYFGGISGTSLLTWGNQQVNGSSTVSGAAWRAKFRATANSSTQLSVFGEDGLDYFPMSWQQQVTTVSNTTSKQFVLAATPSASAVSISCLGFVSERQW